MKTRRYEVYTATACYEGRDLDDCLYHLWIWAKAWRVSIRCIEPDGTKQTIGSIEPGADKIDWR